jgi:Protein of unknown function (DUF3592)
MKFFRRTVLLLLLLLLSVPAFFVFLYIKSDISLYTSLHQETAVSMGRIVVCRLEREYNDYGFSDTCAPTVDFTTASGKKIEFVSSYSASGFSQGDAVQVNYDPHHPQDAVINSWQLWAGDVFLGGMVLVSVGCGFVVLVKRHRRKRSGKGAQV